MLKDSGVEEEVIWTDGPSSEFKNRYLVRILMLLGQKYKKNFTWKYFATSHGKGIVDGVRGRAKSIVQSAVMSKKRDAPVVQSSTDFASLAENLLTKTSVHHMSQEQIDTCLQDLNPWVDVPAVQGIQKMHVVHYEFESGTVKLWHDSMESVPAIIISTGSASNSARMACAHGTSTEDTNATPQEEEGNMDESFDPNPGNTASGFSVGEWCIIKYENVQYPGEITCIKNGQIEVSVIYRSGKYFKWPKQVDKIFYLPCDIVKKINPPVVAGSRGQFDFKDFP